MYWEYFGFKEPPFALTPNPAFLFLSAPHQEAFAHLLFAIENRVGFIELSGEVGAGKTTIVRTLLNQLDSETYRTALVFNPTLSPLGLLQEVSAEFGLPCQGTDMREIHQCLNRYLLEENRAGRTVVLVIDEAQNLAVDVLEQIRLISNLETDSDKLIQIVLVGQPELNTLLARPELRQLDQRITVRYHLKSMDFTDTAEYIRHRIRFAADGREPLTFSPGAVKRIYRRSKGLPRLINGICDRALLLAYTRESKVVSPAMAAASIADLRKEGRRKETRPARQMVAACAVIALLGFAVFKALPAKVETEAKKSPVAPVSAASELSGESALKGLAAVSEQQNLYTAVNAVLAAWQAPALQPVPGLPASLRTLARQRGMTITKVPGNLDALAKFDAPALLQIPVPGGNRLLAVTAIGKDGISVVPAVGGKTRVTPSELGLVWKGGAMLLWKDLYALSSRTKPVEKAEGEKLLQGLLRQVGCYASTKGTAAQKTRAAIVAFQHREQIAADGQATGQTLLLLYRRAGGFFPPSISRDERAGKGDGEHAGQSDKAGQNG